MALGRRRRYRRVMRTNFLGDDRLLLDRYVESVLLRFGDGKYNLAEATEELSLAFVLATGDEPGCLDHMRGVIEAGDDA